MRLEVDGGDTWNEEVRVVGPTSEGRVRLHRSLSF